MKKKITHRVLASVTALSMLISCVYITPGTTAEATDGSANKTYTFEDNFEDGFANWQTLTMAASPVSTELDALKDKLVTKSTADSAVLKKVYGEAFELSASNKAVSTRDAIGGDLILTPDDEHSVSGRVKKVSFDAYIPTTTEEWVFMFIPYYNPSSGAYIKMDGGKLAGTAEGYARFRTWPEGNISAEGDDLTWNKRLDSLDCKMAEWAHIELAYDYSNYVSYQDDANNQLSITISTTTINTENKVVTNSATLTIQETSGLTTNDFVFGFRNNADQSYYDNFSVEYEVKPGEFALWSHIGENNGVAETNQFISYTGDAHGTNRYIKSAEMNIGTSSLSVSDGTEMRVIYAYQDAKNYHYFAYSFDGNKGIYGRLRQVADGVDSAEDLSVFYAAPALSNGGLTKFSDGVGVKDNYTVTLEYLTNRKAKITFVNNQNTEQTASVTITTNDTSVNYITSTNQFLLYTTGAVTFTSIERQVVEKTSVYTAEDFQLEFERLLTLTRDTVKKSDKAEVQVALMVYEDLCDETVQAQLVSEKELLDDLLNKIEGLERLDELGMTQPTFEDKDSSYTFVDDFEDPNCLSWWNKVAVEQSSDRINMDGNGVVFDMERVEDPTGAKNEDGTTNYVLKLDGLRGMAQPYWFTAPDHAALAKVSYDVIGFDDSWWGLRIVSGSLDGDNHSFLDFDFSELNEWHYRWWCYQNGSTVYHGSKTQLPEELDLAKGFNVTITYNRALLRSYITITSLDNADVTATIEISYGSQQYQMGLSVITSPWARVDEEAAYHAIYYDNVEVEYVYGEWDEDIKITSPIVYHAGNTKLEGGDTAMLTGEDLGTVVKSIHIIELENDADVASSGFILQNNYNESVDVDYYTEDEDCKEAKDAYESAVQSAQMTEGYPVEIIQKTDSGIKFIVPEHFGTGVYAVKLTPKGTAEPVYVYLNRPEIDFTLGNEGDIVTVGDTIRVIGKKLALLSDGNDVNADTETKVSDLGVKAVMKKDGTKYKCEITEVQSIYSLSVKIPDDVEAGEYRLYIYNGFGDDSAWSAPTTITVGESPRANWKTEDVFDVSDYGANPEEGTIDTAGFVSALEAADLNGGGTVYVPAGFYTITYTLQIPENVRLIGDGKQKTNIIFSSSHYDFNQLPDMIVAVEGNAEISGLSILATRTPSMIGSGVLCENVYIDDVQMEAHPYKGTIGNGSGGKRLVSDYNTYSYLIARETGESCTLDFVGSSVHDRTEGECKNIQITNSVVDTYIGTLRIKASGLYMANNDLGRNMAAFGTHNILNGEKIIFENNERNGKSFGGNFDGRGAYYDGNEFGDVNFNNGEIITTDGGINYGNNLSGIIRKDETDESGLIYRFDSGTEYVDDRWVGQMVMVVRGQGAYQVREVVDSYDDVLVLDSPFVVEPNRNSRIYMEAERDDWIYVNNQASSGTVVGSYGTSIGSVYDNFDFTFCSGLYFESHDYAPNWYISFANINVEESMEWHVNADGTLDHTRMAGIRIVAKGPTRVMNHIEIRDCTFKDNSCIHLATSDPNNIINTLIEGCDFEDTLRAICYEAAKDDRMDGILVKDCAYTNVKYPFSARDYSTGTYSSSYRILQNSVNNYGNAKFYVYVDEDILSRRGDVNMDGQIDATDEKLIRLMLTGSLEFSEEMNILADVNEDTIINMQDVVVLRRQNLSGGTGN